MTIRHCPICNKEVYIPDGLNCHTCECGGIYIFHPKAKSWLFVGMPVDRYIEGDLETKTTKQQGDDTR